MEPLVYVTRGEIIECVHYGDIAVCDAAGSLLASVGDPSRLVYWRSSAKPVQALLVVQSGAADRFCLTVKELSLCCASHCGSADHVSAARSILRKVDLEETNLQCGTHWPSDDEERSRLIKADLQPSPVHNNCSGKHAGMLASAVAMEADPATYLELDHPVQQAILRNMSVLCAMSTEDIAISADGCSAPVHGVPLAAMAAAFARLCAPDDMPPGIQSAAPRLIAAMASEPVMVSGEGSFNSELLAAG